MNLSDGNTIAPLSISCGPDAEVDFSRCCFEDSMKQSSPYLDLHIEGKVKFGEMVCFDKKEELALKISGNGDVDYDGDDDDFFEDCECFVLPYTETTESDDDDDDDESSGSGLSGGEIAAIVVVLLVVIAVAVVVVIFLILRRRKHNTSSEEEPTAKDEEPQTTTDTTTDNLNDWGVVTEDNMIFAPSEDQGDNVFNRGFEENYL